MVKIAGLVLGWALLALPAQAQTFKTGNDLLELCRSKLPTELAICIGYVVGVSDAITAAPNQYGPQRVCVPVGATQGQVRDLVVKRLEQHPEVRHFRAASSAYVALQEAFPCK